MIYKIRYFGDPVLRKIARPVTGFDAALQTLTADLIETMFEANGVGLAAPQVGISERLFVALELAPQKAEDEADGEVLTSSEKRERWGVVAEHVMVNPEIIARNGVQHAADGCLSVPGLFVENMQRDLQVRVRYQNLKGEWQERSAEGHFAHVIQHELDHLNGVLFFDRLQGDDKRAFLDAHRSALAELQREAKTYLKELKHEKGLKHEGVKRLEPKNHQSKRRELGDGDRKHRDPKASALNKREGR